MVEKAKRFILHFLSFILQFTGSLTEETPARYGGGRQSVLVDEDEETLGGQILLANSDNENDDYLDAVQNLI